MRGRYVTEDVLVRRMTPEDYDGALALWVSCEGMGLRSEEDSRCGVESFLRRNPETCFVAVSDGSVVGTVLAGSDGRRGYLYHVAVNARFRRRGVGTGLVQRALKALRQNGIRKTAVVVYNSNLAGNAFWEQIGFTVREDLVYRNRALSNQ